jgi:cell wall-associated NlpC family hydrolase
MNIPQDLQAGDILLYNRTEGITVAEKLIAVETKSPVTHAEIYMGNGEVATARVSGGVDYFPFDPNGLLVVRRPSAPFDLPSAVKFFEDHLRGKGYGYGALLANIDLPDCGLSTLDCSAVTTLLAAAGGCPQFDLGIIGAQLITPRDLLLSTASVAVFNAVQTTGGTA